MKWDTTGCAAPASAQAQATLLSKRTFSLLDLSVGPLREAEKKVLEENYNRPAWWLSHRESALSHLQTTLGSLRKLGQQRARIRWDEEGSQHVFSS